MDLVVESRNGVARVDGADRNRRRRIAGRRDASVAHLARQAIRAFVAGRGDDDDARRDGALDGLHQWIGRRRLVDGMPERQIQHVDPERGLVRYRELDGLDHGARISRARWRRAREDRSAALLWPRSGNARPTCLACP